MSSPYTKFSKRREEPSTKSFQLSIFLTQSKLYSEPINSGQLKDILITSPQRSESNLMRKISKIRVCKQRNVTQKLVANIPTSIKRNGNVSYGSGVYRGLEWCRIY
jgi:hypothetical protein